MTITQMTDGPARATVIGGGLALTRTPGHTMAIYAMTGGRVCPVGRFDRAVDAWKAVDALDTGSGSVGTMRRFA